MDVSSRVSHQLGGVCGRKQMVRADIPQKALEICFW